MQGKVSERVEEVEIAVDETIEQVQEQMVPVAESVRRLVMASVGAVALTIDEVEQFVQKLVDRGEVAQKEGEKLLTEARTRLRVQTPQVEAQVTKVNARVEHSVEEFLNRLNIPSKRDIDELSNKIAQLSARVEELRKTRTKPTGIVNDTN